MLGADYRPARAAVRRRPVRPAGRRRAPCGCAPMPARSPCGTAPVRRTDHGRDGHWAAFHRGRRPGARARGSPRYDAALVAVAPADRATGTSACWPPHPDRWGSGLATRGDRSRDSPAPTTTACACCLETSTVSNRDFYQRRGFTQAVPVPIDGGPPTWWMTRRPATTALTTTKAPVRWTGAFVLRARGRAQCCERSCSSCSAFVSAMPGWCRTPPWRVADLVGVLVGVQRSLDRGVVTGVMLAGLDLLHRRLRDVVGVEEVAELVAHRLPAVVLVAHPVGVGLLRCGQRHVVGLRGDDGHVLDGQRLVHLDELAVGEPQDAAGLVAVQQLRVVAALEPEAGAPRDHEHDRRDHEQGHPQEPDDRVDRQVERDGDDVVGAADPQQQVERDRHHAQRGAGGGVARAVEQVVLALVAGDPGLDERVEGQDREQDARQDQRRYQDVPRDR